MWQRSVRDDERCGCGAVSSCPFWPKVGRAAFGGWDQVDVDRVTRLRAQVDRGRFLPLLACPPLRRRLQPALDEYVAYYRRTYAAIAQVSGSPVVIDSSKHASLAFCLRSFARRGPEGRARGPRQPGGRLFLGQGRGPAGRGRQPDGHLPAGQRGVAVERRRTAPCNCSPSSARPRCGCVMKTSSRTRRPRSARSRRSPACRRPGLRVPGHRRARPLVGRTGGHAHRVGQPDAVHHRPGPDPLRRHLAERDAGR